MLKNILDKRAGLMWDETREKVQAMALKVGMSSSGSVKVVYKKSDYKEYDKEGKQAPTRLVVTFLLPGLAKACGDPYSIASCGIGCWTSTW